MNVKRFILAILGAFVTYAILDLIIHMLILGPEYKELAHVWREDMMDYMWLLYLTHLLFVAIFVLLYVRFIDDYSARSGLYFGFMISFLMIPVGMIGQFVVYPVTLKLTIFWIVFGMIQITLCGLVAGLIYRPARKT